MTMPDVWRRAFLIHADTPEYRQRVRQASMVVGDALGRYGRMYLAYSGGKDSTAMIHVVTRLCPDIAVLHSDEDSPAAILNEIVDVAHGAGARSVDVRRPLDVDAVAAEGYDAVFVGLRREESRRRRRRMDAGGRFGPIPESWPLAAWTWRDVWAYLVSNGIPYLSLYDTVAPVVGYEHARYHHLFDPKIAHTGASTLDGVLHWRHRGPAR